MTDQRRLRTRRGLQRHHFTSCTPPGPNLLALSRQCRTSTPVGASRPRPPRDARRREPRAPRDCRADRRFPDHGLRLAVHRIDDDLDRLFSELLGHLRAAGTQQPGGSRFLRIAAANSDHGVIKPSDRISHTHQNTRSRAQNRLTHVTAPPVCTRYCTAVTVIDGLTGKMGPKRGDFGLQHGRPRARCARPYSYSSSDSSVALPPDAAVFTVTTCSSAKRPQIVRTAGLRPCPDKPAPAERLRSDHGADHVSVHIDVAVRQRAATMRATVASMREWMPRRQRGAVRRNVVEQLIELARPPAHDMQAPDRILLP